MGCVYACRDKCDPFFVFYYKGWCKFRFFFLRELLVLKFAKRSPRTSHPPRSSNAARIEWRVDDEAVFPGGAPASLFSRYPVGPQGPIPRARIDRHVFFVCEIFSILPVSRCFSLLLVASQVTFQSSSSSSSFRGCLSTCPFRLPSSKPRLHR